MSVTVREWTRKDLDKVLAGDEWLGTLLANATTYSPEMLHARSSIYETLKQYEMLFDGDDEPRILFATSDEMMLKLIDADFLYRPIELWERKVTTSYRQVEFSSTLGTVGV